MAGKISRLFDDISVSDQLNQSLIHPFRFAMSPCLPSPRLTPAQSPSRRFPYSYSLANPIQATLSLTPSIASRI